MTTVWLVRHGETEWSRDGRHTSHTDLELTADGEGAARQIGRRLADQKFAAVLTSPRRRALDTARIAGFGDATVVDDLVEWDYGEYEGITTAQIRETVPGWTVWTHPTPGGETSDAVRARIARVIHRLRAVDGDVLVFGHSHALRGLAACWIGRVISVGQNLKLDTATVSVLGYDRETPAILRWNS